MGTETEAKTPETTQTETEAKTPETTQTISNDTEKLFKELEEENKTLQKKLDDIETKKLEDTKEYKELYEKSKNELELTKKEIADLKILEKSVKTDLLNQLPEKNRKTFEDLSIDKLKELIEITSKTVEKKEPQGGGAKGVDNEVSDSEITAYNKEIAANGGKILDKAKHAAMMSKIMAKGVKVEIID